MCKSVAGRAPKGPKASAMCRSLRASGYSELPVLGDLGAVPLGLAGDVHSRLATGAVRDGDNVHHEGLVEVVEGLLEVSHPLVEAVA